MHTVKEIRDVRPYSLTLVFDGGEVKTVDLAARLQAWSSAPDSAFRTLLDPGAFARVTVVPGVGALAWENGIDLCPDALYAWAAEAEGADPAASLVAETPATYRLGRPGQCPRPRG
jgi:hypothetical protein